MADPRTPGTELGSRDDVQVERLLEDLQHATMSLAISLKSCKRSTDNVVLRMSAEQQFESAMRHAAPLLALVPVAYDPDVARRTTEILAPFLDLVPQLHWMPAGERVTKLFQDAANAAFAEQKIKVEGRPDAAFEALLATRAAIPAPAPEPPPADDPAPAASAEPVVLFEAVFTHGDGEASHHALVGRMYVAFLVHVRGLAEDAAMRSISPAALLGFAQSIDKTLAGYEGVVAFRIVRKDDKGNAQLLRLAAKPPGPAA